jgi:hypothetical protein
LCLRSGLSGGCFGEKFEARITFKSP